MAKKIAKESVMPMHHGGHKLCLGIILLALGLIFYAKDAGWLPINAEFWPVVFITFGLWMILKSLMTKCSCC